MRLLIVLVAVGFFVAICSATSVKFFIAGHCPSSKIGSWTGVIRQKVNTSYKEITDTSGEPSENFFFGELKGEVISSTESAILEISIITSCDENLAFGSDFEILIPTGKGFQYGFRGYNMENKDDKTDSEAYEYLFMKYLEKDCEENECKESSREYVAKGCDLFKKESEQCMKGYDDTLSKFCQKDGSSVHSLCSEYGSTTSSTKMILIIGGAVGAIIVLVLAIAVFFYCRKKKKSKQNLTGTMSGSGTISGTTQQSTGTSHFNTGAPTGTPLGTPTGGPIGAPTGAPTPTGTATTTGVERY
ncbi:hypothetical protein CRE_02399 [Caenorhabditis remanei]|uniref:Uncharacterized protein n=1 Tax=Caenorhabditis remanei TaxID=31234 RepID=E3MIL8_CAERE|nr:hypothetical protein CRE_02399 [Caenorhabditis remanei]